MIHYLLVPVLLVGFYFGWFIFENLLLNGRAFRMNKFLVWGLIVILFVSIFAIMFSGCNVQMVDTHWNFDRAVIAMPNGEVIEGKVESWKDFEDGDQIQVKIDGVTYLTHSANVVLIDD